MDFLEIAARLAGAFYALGGLVAIRSLAVSEMLDRAIAMIKLRREEPKVLVRRLLLGVGGALTGASGFAAALLSWWAVPLFLANVAAQAGWLVWARSAFPPEDEDDRKGRRSTTNAALGYAAVAVAVLYLWRDGRLAPFDHPWTAVPVAAAALGYFAYLVRSLYWAPKGGGIFGGGDGDDWEEQRESDRVRHPARISFIVHPWRYPIVDADDDRLLNHFELLPDIEVAEEIEAWHDRYVGWFVEAVDDAATAFPTPEHEAAHRAEGERFVEYLRATYGRENVEGPVYVPIGDVRLESAY